MAGSCIYLLIHQWAQSPDDILWLYFKGLNESKVSLKLMHHIMETYKEHRIQFHIF